MRAVLGGIAAFALMSYKHAVSRKLGPAVGKFLFVITVTQFHFMFYISRPLPNTFALVLGTTLLFSTEVLCNDQFCFLYNRATPYTLRDNEAKLNLPKPRTNYLKRAYAMMRLPYGIPSL